MKAMNKAGIFVLAISLSLISGCANMQAQAPDQVKSKPADINEVMDGFVNLKQTQEVLEKLAHEDTADYWTPDGSSVKVRVSRDEFYGRMPCRRYMVQVSDQLGGGYACKGKGEKMWSSASRSAVIEAYGPPTEAPQNFTQKELAEQKQQQQKQQPADGPTKKRGEEMLAQPQQQGERKPAKTNKVNRQAAAATQLRRDDEQNQNDSADKSRWRIQMFRPY